MNAARYLFRAELRRGGWRFIVALALLLGIVGGASLLAAGGARRTASAFERLEDETRAGDVLVNPNSEEAQAVTAQRLQDLDGVAAVSHAGGIVALVDGTVNQDVAFLEGLGAGWFSTVDRPVVRDGRLPDQSRPDELFANPDGARAMGLEVGDTVDLVYVSADELQRDGAAGTTDELIQMVNSGAIGHHLSAQLVGIGVTTGDVVPGAVLPAVMLTRGFTKVTGTTEIYGGTSVRLRPGTSVDHFIQHVRGLTHDNAAFDFQQLSADRTTVHRAVTPQAVALLALSVALALGAVLAAGQALGRHAAIRADDDLALWAAGMTAAERRAVHWYRLALVAGLGTLLATAGAAALSSLTPVGVAREIEPTPGFSLDWVVLILGGLVLAGAVAAVGAIATVRAQRATASVPRPSVIASWLRARSASSPLAVGVGLGVEPGRGRTAVPTRSTLAAASVAMAAIVGSLAFAASLDRLVTTPRAYGAGFDAIVASGDVPEGEEVAYETRLAAVLGTAPEVRNVSQLYLEQIRLPHGTASAYGIRVQRGDGPLPTLVRGRIPTGSDEIALGATTMRREGVDLGEYVTASHGSERSTRRYEVVGQVVLPGIAEYAASDQPALGEGALLSLDGYVAVTGIVPWTPGAGSEATAPIDSLVDFAPGATGDQLNRRFDRVLGPGTFAASAPNRSADITSLTRVRSTPLVLAALLGVAAAVAVGHALVVAVTRRRRDLAILRTVGFTPGQVSRAVGWQATTVAVIASVFGIPAGLLIGRLAWAAVARQLGVVNDPATPLAALLALPVAIAFANLVAMVPGWRAARLRPGDILRAE